MLSKDEALKFCIFARSINAVGTRFNAVRINGDGPEVGLDPRTDGVAHESEKQEAKETAGDIATAAGYLIIAQMLK